MSEPVDVMVACGSVPEADAVIEAAVEAGLAACGQRWPITSCFRWDGRIEHEEEIQVLLKSRSDVAERLVALVVERHSYDLPAVTVLTVAATNPGYDDWLAAALDG